MVKFRIYTEDKNRREIEVITTKYFSGFTLIPTVGFYKGAREQSFIIEILAECNSQIFKDIENLCKEIKWYNKQESVLLTKESIDSEFI